MTVELFHVVDGPPDAPVLVMLPSLGSDLSMWDPQVPDLAGDLRVVRLDLRGHGRSPVPPGPYSMDDLGSDVLALVDRLGIERANLCGLSLGAMIAMWMAANAPDRVERLVLCCTAARFEPSEAWVARAATVRAEGADAVADKVVGRWFTPGFAARHPERVREKRAMIAATPAEGYAGCCDAIAVTDMAPSLPLIAAPTLVIAGAEDPASPPEQAYRIAEAIPRAEVVVIPDAAHLANVEQPGAVTRLIRAHVLHHGREEAP